MELHQHLASCDDCRRIFDEYQRIRAGFRQLPPSPPPPPDLALSVWSETIDRPPPTRIRRIFGETTTRVGLTTAALLAVVVIVSAFLLVRGYNQNLPPSASSTTAQTGQIWSIYEPIRIAFNKPMNHTSVEENLLILPPGERDRIGLSWDHNTLILGASPSQSTPLLPNTTYQVVVRAGARDSYGQALPSSFQFSFRTSSIAESVGTPTPVPSGTVAATTTAGQNQPAVNVPSTTQSNRPPATAAPGQGTVSSTGTPVNSSATKPATPSPNPTQVATATSTGTSTGTGNATSTPSPSPTALPTQSAATPSATPAGTPTTAATPTVAATPSATPTTPEQTPSATPVATTPADTGTATTGVIPVTGAFGSVYWANDDVQSKLGAAQSPEAQLSASELGFQHGTMYERFDTGQIYVLYANRTWNNYSDTWTAADGDGGGVSPEDPNLWIPNKSFGKVWNSDPSLSSTIGYAVDQKAHIMGGAVQQFANGIMLYSDQGFVYVVYDNGSWQLYPDTSGHGDLITPTPTAGETPVGTPADATTPEATEPVTPTTTP